MVLRKIQMIIHSSGLKATIHSLVIYIQLFQAMEQLQKKLDLPSPTKISPQHSPRTFQLKLINKLSPREYSGNTGIASSTVGGISQTLQQQQQQQQQEE